MEQPNNTVHGDKLLASPLHREDNNAARRRVLEVMGECETENESQKRTFAQYNKVGQSTVVDAQASTSGIQVLVKNLGLQIYYAVGFRHLRLEDDINIVVHLVLPSENQQIWQNSVNYLSAMVVDPSILGEPLNGLKALFETAMRELEHEATCKFSGELK